MEAWSLNPIRSVAITEAGWNGRLFADWGFAICLILTKGSLSRTNTSSVELKGLRGNARERSVGRQIQTAEEPKGLEVNQVEVENQLEGAALSCGGRCRSTTGGELEKERQEAIGIITGAHGRERGDGLPIVHSPGTSQSNPWHMKGPCRVLTTIRLVCDQEQDHGD